MTNVFVATWKKLLGTVDHSHSMTSKKDVEYLLDTVSNVTGVSIKDMVSRRREREYVTARHIAIQVLLDETDMSCNEIARILNRDHTTIIWVRDKMKKRKRGRSKLNTQLAAVRRALAA